MTPPRLANRLLRCFLTARIREEILGDLAEEFSLRQDPRLRVCWYWGQALRSIPQLTWHAARQGRWIGTFFIAFTVYVAAGVLEFAAYAALAPLLPPGSGPSTALSLIVGLATLTLGGYVSARLRPRAEAAMSLIVFVVVIVLIAAKVGDAPLWCGLAFLVAGPLCGLAGGALFRRRPV